MFNSCSRNVQISSTKCSNLVHKMFKSINNFTANVVKRQHTHNICARKDVKKPKNLKKLKKATGEGDAVGPVEGVEARLVDEDDASFLT